MSDKIHELKAEEFACAIAKGTVLVDFWAPWCGPCRMQTPILERVAEAMPNVAFCKVNVDEAVEIAVKYEIMSIPTLIVFKDGEIAKQFVGLTDFDEIKAALA